MRDYTVLYSVHKSVYTKTVEILFPFTTGVVDTGAAPLIAHIFKKRQRTEMVLIQNIEKYVK
jgi:hypothetical protein